MISEDRVRALAGHRGSCVVTSCYLDVDGRRHPRHADYEAQLDHLLREAPGEGRRVRIRGGPVGGRRPRPHPALGAGRVRPLAGPGAGLLRLLRRRLLRGRRVAAAGSNGMAVNHTPHVRPLESILQAYERFAVVLVDRQRARLFRFELGRAHRAHRGVRRRAPGRRPAGSGQGSRGAHVQRHSDEVAHRHLKHAAEVTFTELQAAARSTT